MKKTIKFSLLFLLASITAFNNTAKAQDVDKEMKAFVKKFEMGYNKEDAETLKAMFTDDAVRTNADGTVTTGNEAIGNEFESQFKANDVKVTITQQKAEKQADGSITTSGTYHVTGKSSNGQPVNINGKYEGTSVKVGGKWKISKQVLSSL